MKKLFLLFNLFIVLFCSCHNDALVSTNIIENSISGTVTIVDENFGAREVGEYKVAAFLAWPPNGAPVGYSNISFTKEGNIYKGTYSIKNLDRSGFTTFVVALGWRTSYRWPSPVLGAYGCDLNSECIKNLRPNVTISGQEGIKNIDFNAYSDTTKKLY